MHIGEFVGYSERERMRLQGRDFKLRVAGGPVQIVIND
jgi:hypothetical protein